MILPDYVNRRKFPINLGMRLKSHFFAKIKVNGCILFFNRIPSSWDSIIFSCTYS